MKVKHLHYLLIGLIILLGIALIGSAIAGRAIMQRQSQNLSLIIADRQIAEEKAQALVQARQDIERFDEINKIAKNVVPQDKDQAKTVREINAIASKNNIPLGSISFPTSALGEDSRGSDSENGESSDTSTPLTQLEPVEGINGVYSLEITVSSAAGRDVPYPQFISFLEDLENNRRTAHVVKISVQPAADPSSVQFTLTLNAYVKP